MKKGLIIVGLTLIFSLMFSITPIRAIESQDENLKVDYIVEKVSEQKAQIKIKVTNVSGTVLSNVQLNNEIPDDFNIDDSSNITIATLGVNESKEYELTVTLKDDVIISGDGDLEKNDPDNNKTEQPNNKNSQVDTGDNVKIGLFVLGGLFSSLIIFKAIKKRRIKSLLSILLVAMMALSSINLVKANEIVSKEIKLTDGIVLNNTDYEFGLHITYQYETIVEDNNTITRGEWINSLVTAMNYPDLTVEIDKPYFNDTAGTIVENSINYAVAYGIVELDDESFYPNQLASREFVAVTTVKALGFIPQDELTCDDANEIEDKQEAYLAVKLGIISLIDNHFYPNDNATMTLVNKSLSVVKDVLDSQNVSNEPVSNIDYKDGVITLQENEVTILENEIIINNGVETEDIQKDSIIVVGETGCYKVTDKSTRDNKTVLGVEPADLNEVIENMNIEGTTKADFSKFIPGENVIVDIPEADTNARSVTTPDIGKMTFEISLGDNIAVKGSLNADITITTKCDIDARFAWPPLDFKNIMLKLDPRLDVEAGIYVGDSEGAIDEETLEKVKDAFKNGKKCKGTINLGKLPVVGIPGCRIYLEFGMQYSLEGHFKVVCNVDGQFGVQVYNNNPRLICSANGSVSPELGGNVKIGPELAGVLKTLGYDIIDLSASTGAAGEGSLAYRPTGMLCADLGAYAYMDMSALKNCVIGDWLDVGWEKSFWDSKNSPLKCNGHFENGTLVENCTYCDATINGMVVDAETNEPISGADVKVFRVSDGQQITSSSTNDLGNFTIYVAGNQRLRVETSKDGYMTCKEEIDVASNEVKQLQTRLQVRGSDGTNEKGKAGGIVSDAQTGRGISDVNIKVRQDWGNKDGEILKTLATNASGEYLIDDMSLGNYTLELSKENYVTGYLNIVITKSGNLQQHATLNPKAIAGDESELRVVLTWGQVPSDIDSHLVGNNDRFHVYYSNKQYSKDGELICDLDVDDTSSYGPETMTLYKSAHNEVYSFYLHNYTNRNSTNNSILSNSGATLTIYVKGEYKQTIYIPTNTQGTLWHAFNYHSDSQEIELVNNFSYQSSPSAIGN